MAFINGTGRVVTQPYLNFNLRTPQLVPTCVAQTETEQIRSLVKLMIERHFFDLEDRNYIVLYASLEEDPFEEIQLHTIRIATEEGFASRSFGTGQYGTEKLSIPADFAAVEEVIVYLVDSAFRKNGNRPCSFKPPVKFRR